jgi:hypothetical protein
MQGFQMARNERDVSIDWNFRQAGLKPIRSPTFYRYGQNDPITLGQHGDFPESDGTDCHLSGAPGHFDGPPGDHAKRWVLTIHPEQGMSIENHASTSQGSLSNGEITSP